MRASFREPAIWLPISLAAGALLTILVSFLLLGIPAHGSDEGTAAHLFQIWFVLEVGLIGFFALKRLPKDPTRAVRVMSLQILTAIVACSPIFYLHL